MNSNNLMDLYINKERKDSALEALEIVKAAIEEQIALKGEDQITASDVFKIVDFYVNAAHIRYKQIEDVYIEAARQALDETLLAREVRKVKEHNV